MNSYKTDFNVDVLLNKIVTFEKENEMLKVEIQELKLLLDDERVQLITIKKDKDILTAIIENLKIYLKEKDIELPEIEIEQDLFNQKNLIEQHSDEIKK